MFPVKELLALALMRMASAGWSPARLHHVDIIGQAHLFRGSAPVSNGTFVFDELRTTMQAAASSEGHQPLPDKFDLIVVSMLDNIKGSEKAELAVEITFLATPLPSGGQGSLVHWPIVGDLISPSTYLTKKLCLSHAKDYDSHGDHMVTKTTALRAMLENASTTPTAVYFHCDAGMDRTGELYGDYSMTYRNQTYKEVYDFDNAIEGPSGRAIHTVNKQALEWMCLYLQQKKTTDPQCNMCQ